MYWSGTFFSLFRGKRRSGVYAEDGFVYACGPLTARDNFWQAVLNFEITMNAHSLVVVSGAQNTTDLAPWNSLKPVAYGCDGFAS